jgi:hypothetical protein
MDAGFVPDIYLWMPDLYRKIALKIDASSYRYLWMPDLYRNISGRDPSPHKRLGRC